MTLRVACPHASTTARISSCITPNSPDKNAPRLITISISSAPSATAAFTSARRVLSGACPEGKAVATDAMRTAVALPSALRACFTIAGYTHTAATCGTPSSGSCGHNAF